MFKLFNKYKGSISVSAAIGMLIIIVVAIWIILTVVIPAVFPVQPAQPANVSTTTSSNSVNGSNDVLINLYFYNPNLDQGPGGARCGRNGLVAVPRLISKTATPLLDAINLLLQGQLSEEEKAQGITTEFPLPQLHLESANIKDGVATLSFSDPQNKTSGGSCRVAVLWSQIEATAKQFTGITSVRFTPEYLFQP